MNECCRSPGPIVFPLYLPRLMGPPGGKETIDTQGNTQPVRVLRFYSPRTKKKWQFGRNRYKLQGYHFWVIRYRCDTCWKPTLYTLWKVIQTRASMWKKGLCRTLEASSSSKGNISKIQSQMLSLQGSNLGISIQRKSLHESALSLHQSEVSSPSDIEQIEDKSQVTGCQTSDIYYRILHSLNTQLVMRIAITTQVCRDQSLLCCLTWSMKRWRL